MTPRKTKQGASARGRSASGSGSGRAAASSRPRQSSTPRRAGAKASGSASRSPRSRAGAGAARKPASRRLALPQRWWTIPALLSAAFVLFVWVYYPVAAVEYRESKERARLQAELDVLKARNDRLRTQVDRLKTPAGVEDYARSQLGLVKKGENVVVVVDGKETTAAAGADEPAIDSDETLAEPVSPWTALLDLIFGLR